ncbi:hypothetical protein [Ramlibacter tataouinensis]|uniref:Uncharacterized protein n=1 Tax=Ramlibacter tataouinensis (strain ATCC BAA-407 / DSM 14655 / LMG 21543 / TTB310) TaxID=365046 RepID=F5Y3N4_RAMTT|nr:hypothetical protein [Ramlibacter tataouinensis]AEG93691.1 Hypothetical protein Rta_25910 [Ramlibacter tataouinensis TTB310]
MRAIKGIGMLLVLLGGTALLGACGGDGDDDNAGTGGGGTTTTSSNELPVSATASSSGLIAYLNELIANRTDETSEPIRLGNAVLPTDDAAEPAAVTR